MKLRLTPGWAVSVDAKGNFFIVDAAGMRPLQHPDRVQRLFAFHLAAAAPDLRNSLDDLTRRLEYIHEAWPTDRRDEKRIQIAHGALIYSRPYWSDVERALAREAMLRERRERGQRAA